MGTNAILRVDNLRMSFGEKEVLHGLSFEVGRGEIFGFIGPNGAGKTTTIRILATLLVPAEGELWLDDIPIVAEPEEVRRRVGYMPDYVGVYPGLTVREYLEFFAAAFRIRGARRRAVVNDVLELTDVGKLADTEVQVLSKGMRQRLCLAQTLIHDPDLLILDEPASGLDPRARIEFRALLKELRAMGKTIFLSSHILTELSPICDAVGIIEAGRLVTHGSVGEILARISQGTDAYRVTLAAGTGDGAERAARALREHPQVSSVALEGEVIRFHYAGVPADLHAVFAAFTSERVSFTSVTREAGDLETIFMRLTRGDVS